MLESEWFCHGLMKDMWIIHFIFIYFKVMYNIYYHNIWVSHSLCCYLHISLVRSYYFHCTAEQSNQPATQGGFTLLLCQLQHLSQTLSLVKNACTQERMPGLARRCLRCTWLLSTYRGTLSATSWVRWKWISRICPQCDKMLEAGHENMQPPRSISLT